MKRTCLVTLLLVFTGLSVLGAPPNQDSGSRQKKEPWELSPAERIAARSDPGFLKANTRSAEDSHRIVGAEGITGHPILVVNGKTNPEIFFRFELFNWMLSGLDDEHQIARDITRSMMRDRMIAFGYKDPDAFWRELADVIPAHLALIHQSALLNSAVEKAD